MNGYSYGVASCLGLWGFIVLALQFDDVYGESILGFPVSVNVLNLLHYTCANAFFCEAGFRPGRRATFVLAKVAKTIDAQCGLLKGDGRKRRGARQLAALKQGSPIDERVHSEGRTAGVGLWERRFKVSDERARTIHSV